MSNDIQRLNVNARMSQVVIANGVVYLSGQVCTTRGASVTVQTTEVLQKIDDLLALAKVDKSRLLTAMVWLTDVAAVDKFNAVWDAWTAEANAPTRACVQAALVRAGLDVEVAVTALAA